MRVKDRTKHVESVDSSRFCRTLMLTGAHPLEHTFSANSALFQRFDKPPNRLELQFSVSTENIDQR